MPRPRRVLWGITPRKKLDYARLIDAAEDGEELASWETYGRGRGISICWLVAS